jgi:hypothetical protein
VAQHVPEVLQGSDGVGGGADEAVGEGRVGEEVLVLVDGVGQGVDELGELAVECGLSVLGHLGLSKACDDGLCEVLDEVDQGPTALGGDPLSQ